MDCRNVAAAIISKDSVLTIRSPNPEEEFDLTLSLGSLVPRAPFRSIYVDNKQTTEMEAKEECTEEIASNSSNRCRCDFHCHHRAPWCHFITELS